MLKLAESYYGAPGLEQRVLANAPPTNIRDTEKAVVSALQLGQIDCLAIYRCSSGSKGWLLARTKDDHW